MLAKLEAVLWIAVVALVLTYACVDSVTGGATPAHANDSGGGTAAITAGSFFVVDTENQWIGLYTQPGNQGPRLVSAQNYQHALVLAGMPNRTDSEKLGCETAAGWSAKEVAEALTAAEKAATATAPRQPHTGGR